MSDAATPPPPREWRFYLDDMIGFAERVLAYTDGLDQAAFDASGLNYFDKHLSCYSISTTETPSELRTMRREGPAPRQLKDP